MNGRERVKLSKFMSLVLRHDPGCIGIALDEQGWVAIDDLLAGAARQRVALNRERLETIVATSDKRRFAISDDGLRIRANQGHSVEVDLQLEARQPPEVLFHGTVARFLDSIAQQGLLKGARRHVHLSADRETACARRGATRQTGHPGSQGFADARGRPRVLSFGQWRLAYGTRAAGLLRPAGNQWLNRNSLVLTSAQIRSS